MAEEFTCYCPRLGSPGRLIIVRPKRDKLTTRAYFCWIRDRRLVRCGIRGWRLLAPRVLGRRCKSDFWPRLDCECGLPDVSSGRFETGARWICRCDMPCGGSLILEAPGLYPVLKGVETLRLDVAAGFDRVGGSKPRANTMSCRRTRIPPPHQRKSDPDAQQPRTIGPYRDQIRRVRVRSVASDLGCRR